MISINSTEKCTFVNSDKLIVSYGIVKKNVPLVKLFFESSGPYRLNDLVSKIQESGNFNIISMDEAKGFVLMESLAGSYKYTLLSIIIKYVKQCSENEMEK